MPYGFNADKSKFDLGKIVTTATLSRNGWNNKVYSFESAYPSTEYDVEIEPDGDNVTSAHLDALSAARLVGSSTSNVVKAIGTVPTIDIPIIIRVVRK